MTTFQIMLAVIAVLIVIIGSRKSQIEALLDEMKERPENFVEFTSSTLEHKPSGQLFWVANGLLFYGVYRPTVTFTFADKLRFHFALREMRKQWLRDNLCRAKEEK